MKSQGKPGMVREFSIISIQVSLGKEIILSTLFSLPSCMLVCKLVAAFAFVISKCELYHFA